MAATTVFVDDVVLGKLPPICVKTGAPADTWAKDRADVGRLGAAWVLLFFGPPGWVIFMALALFGRDRLTVVLPFSRAMLDEIRHLTLIRNVLAGAVGLALVAAVALPKVFSTAPAVGIVLLLTAVMATMVVQLRLAMREVDVILDASGRWVTLRGVSESFAREVKAQQQRATA